MMTIRVFGAPIGKIDLLDENGYIDVEEGLSVQQLLQRLKVPLWIRYTKMYVVNYKQVDGNYILQHQDIVSLMVPMAGG